MASPIKVIERVTDANLFPLGYLLMNRDLKKAFGNNEKRAQIHYDQYGRGEGRFQVTREFLQWSTDPDKRRSRFDFFKTCLSDVITGQSFPLRIGYRHENVDTYLNESVNANSSHFLAEILAHPARRYADIGAGLREAVCENCVYLEVYPSISTDIIVEPGAALPFNTASLDGVGCFAVLEHVRRPWETAQEIARIVKPGGKVFIDWPFLQPVHGFPSHYYNATREGLRSIFSDNFEVTHLFTGKHEGPDYTISWILRQFISRIKNLELKNQIEQMTIADLTSHDPESPFWSNILSGLTDEDVATLSCGNYLIAVRK